MLNLEGNIHMKTLRLLPLSLILALSAFGSAYAQAPALAAGTYKLAIGSKAPCDVTITADGTVSQATDCAPGTNLSRVTPKGSGYLLISASGDLYGVVKPNGDTLEGTTFADQRKLVLSH
jgi:hypothetical protein